MHRWVRLVLLRRTGSIILESDRWIQRKEPKTAAEPLITEVASTKRIPSANYSLSIALQENALRVMCLTRGRPGTAPGEPELLQTRPAHQPWWALMQRVRSRIISAPRLSPEVWRALLGPSGPAASHWLDNSQIQRLDPEKSPENHRRATNITEVASTKRIPSANYSLSIALQENALRVNSPRAPQKAG